MTSNLNSQRFVNIKKNTKYVMTGGIENGVAGDFFGRNHLLSITLEGF